MKNLKQKLTLLFLLIINFSWAQLCNTKPSVIFDYTVTHGAIDWVIVVVVSIIIIYTLIFSIKYLAKPGEKKSNHIKYSILQD
ncbi:MAG: hypothetical protein H7195_10595 [Chryseobacterium sp.]|nr:hypothetical protein [Chryseobacterium sp.]